MSKAEALPRQVITCTIHVLPMPPYVVESKALGIRT